MNWSREWGLALGGVATAIVATLAALPWLVRPIFRLMLWPRYTLRVRGLEHLPKAGPALLAANHVTWIDGFVLTAACPRRGKALVNASYINWPGFRHLARWIGLIPVPSAGPRAQRAAIDAARGALDRGEVLAIFPEAQLSRNGLTGPFFRGLEVMLAKREAVPVIPVYLDNLWGSLYSFSGGKTFRKRPEGWRRTVGVVFGPPVPPPITAFAVRQGVLEAGVRAFALRDRPIRPLETLDPSLPRWEHPELGLLASSTADYHSEVASQVGQKPGTVGQPVPGVALRVIDDAGTPLPPDAEGRIQALLAGRPDWVETGRRGRLDRDGFLSLSGTAAGGVVE